MTRRRIEQSTFDLCSSQSNSVRNSLSQNPPTELSTPEPSESSLGDSTEQLTLSQASSQELAKVPEYSAHTSWLGCCCEDSCGEAKRPWDAGYVRVAQPTVEAGQDMVVHFESAPQPPPPVVVARKVEKEVPQKAQRQTFPLPTTSSTELGGDNDWRRSYAEPSVRISTNDNGIGPFLSSLKMNRRKVLRSSDFN